MLHFGRLPVRQDDRTLKFGNYLTPALPSPPVSYSVLDRVYQNLNTTDQTALFPMDGNDKLGDCTIAAAAHAITAYRGLINEKLIMGKCAVVRLYSHLTGGLDTGLNELDVLKFWRKHAIRGDKILAFTSIDVKNHMQVEQATRLFGGVYLGFQVQQNAIRDFENQVPWTPGTLTDEGHAVYVVAYDLDGVTVLTWGNTQQATWAWWDECVDEAWAILPPEAKKPAFAPGFNFAQLQADLAVL